MARSPPPEAQPRTAPAALKGDADYPDVRNGAVSETAFRYSPVLAEGSARTQAAIASKQRTVADLVEHGRSIELIDWDEVYGEDRKPTTSRFA